MMPTAPHMPAAPAAQSPLAAVFARHGAAQAPMQRPGGPMPQAAGAPMPLNAGGHPAGRFGHAPQITPGC